MTIARRQLLSDTVLGLALLQWAGPSTAADAAVTPEQFGARGDGIANDTAAFARLAAHVAARGGGTIQLRPTTYLVGRQLRGFEARTGYAFEPEPILLFTGLASDLTIVGNGARLRCAPGLRYGTFDAGSGRKTSNPMPYVKGGELATPYRAMIEVSGSAGAVTIRDLELDGNLQSIEVGGQYGDTGWQIPATGILLRDNRGSETIVNVFSHHHPLDGIQVDGLDRDRPADRRSRFENVRCEHNGRQGMSLVGGRGYRFAGCNFSHTGRVRIASNPGAGVDIEAEAGKLVRDLLFEDCRFADNTGAGMVADSGNSEAATFARCTFIGTTNWSAWPNKPRFRFEDCTFVGAIVHARGDEDPARAVSFRSCRFLDDPALSPIGKVYGGENPDRPIADLPGNRNVRFEGCRFDLTADCVLPWSVDVTYADCILSQKAPAVSYPRGIFLGRNIVSGRSNLTGARVIGELIHNGQRILTGGPL